MHVTPHDSDYACRALSIFHSLINLSCYIPSSSEPENPCPVGIVDLKALIFRNV